MPKRRVTDITVSGRLDDQRFRCGNAEARVFRSNGGWSLHAWIGLTQHVRSRHDSRTYAVRKAREFVRLNRRR